jgi:(2Fe-2S) ferredoxin
MEFNKVPYKSIIFVCTNTRDEDGRVACASHGRQGAKLRDLLKEAVQARGLKGKVRVSASGCMDLCEEGPNVMVFTEAGERVWYKNVSETDLPAILDRHAGPAPTRPPRAPGE